MRSLMPAFVGLTLALLPAPPPAVASDSGLAGGQNAATAPATTSTVGNKPVRITGPIGRALDYEQGIAAYNQKEYAKAAALLSAAVAHGRSKDQAAHYLLANALIFLRKNDEARKEYQTALALNESPAVSEMCRKALYALGSTSPNASIEHESVDDALKGIRFDEIKAGFSHPAMTDDFRSQVRSVLASMPRGVRQIFRSGPYGICLASCMIDKFPDANMEKPRGWYLGATQNNVGACFANPDLIICEYRFDANANQWKPQYNMVGTVRHETGHAIDTSLDMFSESDAFQRAYATDFSKLSDAAKRQLSYFCYNNSGARSETFAELTAYVLGGSTLSEYMRMDALLADSFPNSLALVKRQIDQLSAGGAH